MLMIKFFIIKLFRGLWLPLSFFVCKDSANRVKYKAKTWFLAFTSEVPPFFWKDSANRVKYKAKTLFLAFTSEAWYVSFRLLG